MCLGITFNNHVPKSHGVRECETDESIWKILFDKRVKGVVAEIKWYNLPTHYVMVKGFSIWTFKHHDIGRHWYQADVR